MSKMVVNSKKNDKMFQNCPKCFLKNCQKWSDVVPNDPKWSKILKQLSKWSNMARFYQKRFKIVQKIPKWLNMVKNHLK